MTGPGGLMHGQRLGMMGQGLGFMDPADYLNSLKVALGITLVREQAWNEYVDTVKGSAGQCRARIRPCSMRWLRQPGRNAVT
jgi:hypothetical protein